MTGTHGQIQYTRDISSGRVHKRIRSGATFVPYGGEQDNLDDAGQFEIITPDALDGAEPADLCLRCFPDKQDGQAE